MRNFTKLVILVSALSLSGCSAFDWLVYKIDIPQGNYVDDAKVEQLRVQMSAEQVQFVLGTPMLIDTFDKSRWYYLYRYQNGNGPLEERELVLQFSDDGRLVSLSGDYTPSPNFNQALDL
ncbi:outer membrane protein assembly factor BamE [Alginatibacterium sediminis]|uniref:Outer membrane protein assembly factor BamE n=1 Tax=Alginatibacterium sediminis TaxID=2164068 RepID=A0A420EA06_9ALTE|nr:outer membrane protein assembly factor BamE [Alginatibacterium sediminis]RKF17505.1 outer membrane protein assembly factor BamE [Alginatibacterium sediminis]